VFHLATAIEYMQTYGIIHRDLKLENIMMTDDTDEAFPKIIDFGLARILVPEEYSVEPFGTLGYVGPEVLKRNPYRFSCDLWSLGCITYALLSGSLPFDHTSSAETIRRTTEDPLSFDSACWSRVTSEGKSFLVGLLEKDP